MSGRYWLVLAIINFVQKFKPSFHWPRCAINFHSIDKSGRCAAHCLTSRIFPHGTSVHICLVNIVVVISVKACKSRLIQVELCRNLSSPLCDKVILANVAFRKNCVKLLVAVILILVQIALSAVSDAKILQVWYDLSDLERMGVVWQWEGSICPVYLVCYCAVEPFSL